MFGFLNINKPSGISSHKVVSILRQITGIKQIGHAGTLDPLASGVLPVALGKASKLIDYLPDTKEYNVGMYLGKISDTYDTEGNVTETNYAKVNIEEIEKAVEQFRGEIIQIPPAFSAVHYKGKRLYELARNGNIPNDIPKRKVTIFKNEIISFDYEKQILKLSISCSKGTYIRSIVHDIGNILKSGAVMYQLIRTKSSGFDINNSIDLDENITKEKIFTQIINPIEILKLNKKEITEQEYEKVLNGNKFKTEKEIIGNLLLTKNNKIIALAQVQNGYIQPKKVLI